MNKTVTISKDKPSKIDVVDSIEVPKATMRAGAGRRATAADGSSERTGVVNIYETSQ